jgi:hypothetical protein
LGERKKRRGEQICPFSFLVVALKRGRQEDSRIEGRTSISSWTSNLQLVWFFERGFKRDKRENGSGKSRKLG